jgi:hypothetical protein
MVREIEERNRTVLVEDGQRIGLILQCGWKIREGDTLNLDDDILSRMELPAGTTITVSRIIKDPGRFQIAYEPNIENEESEAKDDYHISPIYEFALNNWIEDGYVNRVYSEFLDLVVGER